MIFLIAIILLLSALLYTYITQTRLNEPWTPDPESIFFSQRPLPKPDPSRLAQNYTLPFHTQGSKIVDSQGKRFKLASVNWYGASDALFLPGGLDIRHRNDIAQTIVNLGLNSVRMPYSDELVIKNPTIEPSLVLANPDLANRTALDVFTASVTALTNAGLAVIINNHITSAQWCCGANPCDASWSNDHIPLCRIPQTQQSWIQNWEKVMSNFVDNPLVIAADLRNEVRGLWGTMPWSRWANAAKLCGDKLHDLNPELLIIVGGTESGNDLSGVSSHPVLLNVPDKLVYSAHVYSWSGWGSFEGRFALRTYGSFARTMVRNWAYLLGAAEKRVGASPSRRGSTEEEGVPVWVGEFGAPRSPSVGDHNYWANLMRFLRAVDADFGYWALNPRKMPGFEDETYGLLKDDWETPVLDYRMRDLQVLMRT